MRKFATILMYLHLIVGWGYYFAYQEWFTVGKPTYGIASLFTLIWGAMGYGIWRAIRQERE